MDPRNVVLDCAQSFRVHSFVCSQAAHTLLHASDSPNWSVCACVVCVLFVMSECCLRVSVSCVLCQCQRLSPRADFDPNVFLNMVCATFVLFAGERE